MRDELRKTTEKTPAAAASSRRQGFPEALFFFLGAETKGEERAGTAGLGAVSRRGSRGETGLLLVGMGFLSGLKNPSAGFDLGVCPGAQLLGGGVQRCAGGDGAVACGDAVRDGVVDPLAVVRGIFVVLEVQHPVLPGGEIVERHIRAGAQAVIAEAPQGENGFQRAVAGHGGPFRRRIGREEDVEMRLRVRLHIGEQVRFQVCRSRGDVRLRGELRLRRREAGVVEGDLAVAVPSGPAVHAVPDAVVLPLAPGGEAAGQEAAQDALVQPVRHVVQGIVVIEVERHRAAGLVGLPDVGVDVEAVNHPAHFMCLEGEAQQQRVVVGRAGGGAELDEPAPQLLVHVGGPEVFRDGGADDGAVVVVAADDSRVGVYLRRVVDGRQVTRRQPVDLEGIDETDGGAQRQEGGEEQQNHQPRPGFSSHGVPLRSEVEVQEDADAGERERAEHDEQHGGQRVDETGLEVHGALIDVWHAQAGDQRGRVPDQHVQRVVSRMEAAGQREGGGDALAQGAEVHHEHGPHDGDGVREGGCPEEDPADRDEDEGANPLQGGMKPVPLAAEETVEHAGGSVEQAPEQEEPACAVPEAAGQEDDHEVQAGADRTPAAAAQREVDIIGQEAGEGDVPALPELPDIHALVRGVEVHGDADVEHEADAGGHVAVAGEVEVQLEGVAHGHKPGLRRVEGGGGAEARLHACGEGVGDEDLLGQTAGEGEEAWREVRAVRMPVFGIRELRDDLAVQHDGAGDQLGEEGDEERVIHEVIARHGVPVAVDDVGELLEGEEGDAQGQRQPVQREVSAQGVQVFAEEVVVFEPEEHAQVPGQAQQHQGQTPRLLLRAEHELAQRVVEQDAPGDDRDIGGIVPSVEHEGREDQEELVGADSFRQPAQQEIDRQHQRQEGQDEHIGIEQHTGAPLSVRDGFISARRSPASIRRRPPDPQGG